MKKKILVASIIVCLLAAAVVGVAMLNNKANTANTVSSSQPVSSQAPVSSESSSQVIETEEPQVSDNGIVANGAGEDVSELVESESQKEPTASSVASNTEDTYVDENGAEHDRVVVNEDGSTGYVMTEEEMQKLAEESGGTYYGPGESPIHIDGTFNDGKYIDENGVERDMSEWQP